MPHLHHGPHKSIKYDLMTKLTFSSTTKQCLTKTQIFLVEIKERPRDELVKAKLRIISSDKTKGTQEDYGCRNCTRVFVLGVS